tara:strand:+ start:33 stop:395 length:363 start_codon:yes stop_codon:yes gene_type:complete
MGIFGIAKKGFGLLGKSQAKNRMLRGTSTRADRIKHGGRSPDIKSVPVSKDVKKGDLTESIRKGKQHFYIKNIDEVKKHVTDIKKAEKAKKKLKQMRDTKRAFKIGKTKTFASDPSQGNR